MCSKSFKTMCIPQQHYWFLPLIFDQRNICSSFIINTLPLPKVFTASFLGVCVLNVLRNNLNNVIQSNFAWNFAKSQRKRSKSQCKPAKNRLHQSAAIGYREDCVSAENERRSGKPSASKNMKKLCEVVKFNWWKKSERLTVRLIWA